MDPLIPALLGFALIFVGLALAAALMRRALLRRPDGFTRWLSRAWDSHR